MPKVTNHSKSYKHNWQIRPNEEEAEILQRVLGMLTGQYEALKAERPGLNMKKPGPSDVLRFLLYFYDNSETLKEG